MAKSSYIFESGEAIDVGEHGDHDYVFASSEPVSDQGVSPFVFESGVGLRGLADIIEDFERDNPLDDYGGDTDSATVNTTAPVRNGSKSLKFTGTGRQSIATTSLSRLPQEGDTVRTYVQYPDAGGDVEWGWYTQSASADADGYFWQISPRTDDVTIQLRQGGSRSEKAQTSHTFSNHVDEWLYADTELKSGSSFVVTVFQNDGTELASVSWDDPNDTYGSGGMEFDWNNIDSVADEAIFDFVHIP